MPNKILLIGGTGFLGQHLKQVLDNAGFDTHISGTQDRTGDGYHKISFDDEQTYKSLSGYQFDLMIVLAAKLNALGTTQLNHPDLKTNVIAYSNFLEFTVRKKIAKQIIYISSMTVYGRQNKLPVVEEGIIEPVNTYGLSKHMAEIASSFYCRHNNIKGVALRLPGIYGGNRKSGYIYNTARKCIANENIILNSNNLIYWETINVSDLCNLVLRFIQNYKWNTVFDIFNIGYGREIDFYATSYNIKSLTKSKSSITEDGKKGYIPFYLSNEKLRNVVQVDENFETSLSNYLLSFA